jgi:hypothetical protein
VKSVFAYARERRAEGREEVNNVQFNFDNEQVLDNFGTALLYEFSSSRSGSTYWVCIEKLRVSFFGTQDLNGEPEKRMPSKARRTSGDEIIDDEDVGTGFDSSFLHLERVLRDERDREKYIN